MNTTDSRVVIVTGGGSGIGGAISAAFRAQNDRVVIAQRSEALQDDCLYVPTDVSDENQCRTLIEDTVARFGRLDVLINNAGIMPQSSIEDMSAASWDQTMAVNLRAPFLLSKYALPHLRATNGCIVNIGSIEADASNPLHAAYCASKAGLHALTRAMAVDHGKEVRCNAIAPGWINTRLNEEFINSQPNTARFRQNIGAIHPVGRTGAAEEVAQLALFLASDKAQFICGQILTIDGGRTIQLPLPN